MAQYTRGGLAHCVRTAAQVMKQQNIPLLSILAHPDAKYYSVVDDDELAARSADAPGDTSRLLLRASLTELRIITSTPQADLFSGASNES